MIFSKIAAVGSYLPKRVMTNDELPSTLDTSDHWIRTRTGITKRYIAEDNQFTSDLGANALINALSTSNISEQELDGIIVATTTPDLVFPSTAVKIQEKINLLKGFAFDIQAVCSGFIYALCVADSMIKSGQAKKIAVIGAETMSRILDWTDRDTCVLFGDGAGAVILEKQESEINNGVLDIDLFSDGRYIDLLKVDGGVSKGNLDSKMTMNGREVFKHAVTKMTYLIKNTLDKNNFSIKDLDWMILHQANNRIIQAVREKLSIEENKAVSTVEHHANTSAASIPLALDSYIKNEKIKRGDLIAMASIGGGMTWGSALIRY
ncbi:MAG: 3-oxoacyl-[acyl-carrier-protein] synthase-3 [Candidatus Midichloriaceae bacterium]|jgi:3-oxoacyl-[acyl-carrier-protein] synthase-3